MCCAVPVVYQYEYLLHAPLYESTAASLYWHARHTTPLSPELSIRCLQQQRIVCSVQPIARSRLFANRPRPALWSCMGALPVVTSARSRGQFNLPVLPRLVVHLVLQAPPPFRIPGLACHGHSSGCWHAVASLFPSRKGGNWICGLICVQLVQAASSVIHGPSEKAWYYRRRID